MVFADPAAEDTIASFVEAGTYLLQLSADDGEYVVSDGVPIVVTPPNQPPTAEAGSDQTITLPPQYAVQLVGSASDDGLPTGTLQTTWSQVSGPAPVVFQDPASAVTVVTFSMPGDYVLALAATDGSLPASDTVTIHVLAGNFPPTVSAGPEPTVVLPGRTVTLSGSASDDGLPSGSLTTLWTQRSGPAEAEIADPTSPVTQVTLPEVGPYVFRLTASDSAAEAWAEVVARLEAAAPSGDPPVVEILSPEPGATITAPVEIVGTARSDTLLGWRLEHRPRRGGEWMRFAEGTESVENGVLTVFDPTLLLNGTYEVRLVTTDISNRSAAISFSAVVKDNLKVGQFSVSFSDMEVPVAGMPIRVTRSYDSRDKQKGDFGYGWRLDLSQVVLEESGSWSSGWSGVGTGGGFPTYCLLPTTTHDVTVTMPDGQVLEFEAETWINVLGSPTYCQRYVAPDTAEIRFRPRPGTLGKLEVLDAPQVEIVGPWSNHGTADMQLFDPGDFDLYDPDLYKLTLPDGRELLIHQQRGLQSIRDTNGNTLTVGPGGITHSSGRGVVFERDAEGRIESITDPEGHSVVYGYDAAGDLVSVTDREEKVTGFGYLSTVPHHLERIEDPRGIQPIRNDYYPDGRLWKHTDAFGKTIEYTHEIGSRYEEIQDREGGIRVLWYDERGNVVKEQGPDGKQVDRTFDERNNRTSETVPHLPGAVDPPTTHYTYDDENNLTSTTDPLGNTTSYTYNDRGQVLTTTDAREKTTTNVYDGLGNLLSTEDALGNVTGYTYDGQGNVKTQTVTVNGVVQVTGYDYDGYGNLTTETDALGHETGYTYDRNGNRLTETRTRTTPTGLETLTTTYGYDKQGRLLSTLYPDLSSTSTTYNDLGKQETTTDAAGRVTRYDYDLMGRLETTTYPDTTTEESTYDGEGRRLTSQDRAGRVTSYEYDNAGRLRFTRYPAPEGEARPFTENRYDDAGRLETTIDANGNVTDYVYDEAGRRTRVQNVVDGVLRETVFGYDDNGNQDSVTDPKGKTTTYEYDDLNRRTKTVFPDGTFTETGFDELGRRVSETDQAGKVTEFDYDALGRLTTVTQYLDGAPLVTTYGYDEVGNRTTQTDAEGHTTSFEYDRMGRQTKRTLPQVGSDPAAFEEMTYFPDGNLETRADFMGRITSYAYEPDTGRLSSRSYPDGSAVALTYTATGRRETVTDARGVTGYTYDERDRIETLTYPDGRQLVYGYDDQGNRTSLTAIVGGISQAVAYTYDELNRLDTVTDWNGGVYDHGYDANGNRQSLAYPNGVETTYSYDDLNHLTNLTTQGSGGTHIQSYDFTLGPAGNRTQIIEQQGVALLERTLDYTYDDLYRLTGETVTGADPYSKVFTYDDVGNRQTQVTTGEGAGTVDYTYDERDRIADEAGRAYGWDQNGNLRSKDAEATYDWDYENRLTKVTLADGTTVEHVYDADGNRVQTTTTPAGGSPEVVNYLVDTCCSLSHVVAESDGAGNLIATYVRGDDLLAVIRPLVPVPASPEDYQTRYFHADGIGSIRRLTNEEGLITDGYTYEAFGTLLAHTGTDPQPYAFTGEPLDPTSGWQYHRARWMDPGLGRFASVDPLDGGSFKSTSLHRYLYANDTPVDSADPTGLLTLAGALTAMSGFTNAIFGIAVAGQGACGKKCGPDITVPLRNVMAWVDRDFEALSESQQKRACATVLPLPWELDRATTAFGVWDIPDLKACRPAMYRKFPSGCGPSAHWECSASVTVNGRCFDAGDVNYMLFGRIVRLCGLERRDAELRTLLYKWWTEKPVNADTLAWASTGWAGWLATPPSRAWASRCRVGSCRAVTGLTFDYNWVPHHERRCTP